MTAYIAAKMAAMAISGSYYIARHGETIFNAKGRLQGGHDHTPLTRTGFAQIDHMGAELRRVLGPKPDLQLWSSNMGRALQSLSVIAEHLELDWHGAQHDGRLREMDTGDWGGCYYADLIAKYGQEAIYDPHSRLLGIAPNGEDYPQIAARLLAWLPEIESGSTAESAAERLVIMHGISSRVLRGILLGLAPVPGYDVPIAPGLPQGSVVKIANGQETLVVLGAGGENA